MISASGYRFFDVLVPSQKRASCPVYFVRYIDVLDWFDHRIQKGKVGGSLIESVIILRDKHLKLIIFLILMILEVILTEEGSIGAYVDILLIVETDGPMF